MTGHASPIDSKRKARLALALLVPAPSLGVIAAMWIWPGPFGQAIYAFAKFWLLAFPAFWWFRVDRGRLGFSPLKRGGLGVGALTGLVVAGSVFVGYALFGKFVIDVDLMRATAAEVGFDRKAFYLGLVTYLSFVNSLGEEYVWRWFVYRKSETLWGATAATFLTAVFFSIHHAFALYPQFGWPLTIIGSTGTFVGSLIWSWLYRRYGSLWPAYVSHAIIDLSIFAVGWKVLFG